MIHYTLLPEKEMKALRVEYRIRIFIVLLFFISSGIIIGIFSLIPSYIYSYFQEKDSIEKIQSLGNDSISKDNDVFSSELTASSKILERLKSLNEGTATSDYIKRVSSLRSNLITFNSIQILKVDDLSSSTEMILQGRAITRDGLLDFKKILESDPTILKVDSPVSNLTKNKDVEFAFRIRFK